MTFKEYTFIIGAVVFGVLVVMGIVRSFGSSSQRENADSQSIQELIKPDPTKEPVPEDAAVAYFAGGCFWCMEAAYQETPGVYEAVSGFAGEGEQPTYKQVTTGKTQFREAVQVIYDPEQIEFSELVEIFFMQVDPTDPGGQFADRGFQYTTAMYFQTEAEEVAIREYIETLSNSEVYDKPIVTKVEPFSQFFAAVDAHQDFYKNSSTYYKQYEKGSGRKDYKEFIKDKLIELEEQGS